jgi:putative transposase
VPSSGMLPRRRSVRLQNHDYSSGGIYAVTLVTARRRHLFSLIQGDRVRLTPIGRIVEEEWLRVPVMRPRAWLDAFVVMPDHFHGIVGLRRTRNSGTSHDEGSLASLIGGFKSACTRRYRELVADRRASLWQRGFYEHWIRGDLQLRRNRRYILDNPRKWRGP